jgi:F-type H+-transporting ATPase subunit epsilon
MHVHIAKIDEILFSGEALSLTAPGSEGEVTILAHHVPLVTPLQRGIVTVRPHNESPRSFEISSGILEVSAAGATILL